MHFKMEDNKIKDLFQSFQPELSSDTLFLSRLKKNMEAIEAVKRHTAALHRRNRIAVVVAALSGFVIGVAFTLLLPLMEDLTATVSISIPSIGISAISINWQIVGWLVTAGACILTAINVYEITVSKLSADETPA